MLRSIWCFPVVLDLSANDVPKPGGTGRNGINFKELLLLLDVDTIHLV